MNLTNKKNILIFHFLFVQLQITMDLHQFFFKNNILPILHLVFCENKK